MAKTKVAINGMGRIGRTLIREWIRRGLNDLEILAVNNPGEAERYVHLLKYDSVHGVLPEEIKLEGDQLKIGNRTLTFFSERDPSKIPWESKEIDVVIDATGKFRDKESLSQHLGGTVKKVILCAPGKGMDKTLVMGINHETYNHETDHVVSNASCTTNCLAPVAKVLNDSFGVERGFMTTVHAYTSDQNLLDGAHKDMRRARAAALSMIPTTTGAAAAVGEVIPELNGKMDGYAVRVPTPNVSLVDLTVEVGKDVTAEQVNQALQEAAGGNLKGILKYTDEELVSNDYNGMPESSCLDSQLTKVIGRTVKVVAWYDNEVGFSNRVLDLALFVGNKL